jgi:hypothetical protein
MHLQTALHQTWKKAQTEPKGQGERSETTEEEPHRETHIHSLYLIQHWEGSIPH